MYICTSWLAKLKMTVSRWVLVLLLVMTGAKKTKSSKDWNSMDEGDWDKVELLAAAVRASGGGMCMIVMRRALWHRWMRSGQMAKLWRT